MANLLAQHTLAELIDIVEADLSDSTNTYISAAEVQAAVRDAIYDINRILPDQKIVERTLDFDVDDDSFTATHGTAVALDYHPIEKGSESIHSAVGGGTVYTRDTDYTIDYSNGTITTLSTGAIVNSSTVYADYTRSKIAVDLSALTDLIRVVSVEYPIGSVPQKFVDFQVWAEILWVRSRSEKESQEKMGDGNHIAIYYEAEHNIAIV